MEDERGLRCNECSYTRVRARSNKFSLFTGFTHATFFGGRQRRRLVARLGIDVWFLAI